MGSRDWKRAQSAREFEFTTLSLFGQPCFFFGLSAIQNGVDGRAGKRTDDGCRNDNGSDPALEAGPFRAGFSGERVSGFLSGGYRFATNGLKFAFGQILI